MASLPATRPDAAANERFEATTPFEGDATPDRARTTCASGELIAGRYRIDLPLRRGGMADVHVATDLKLQRPVALKVAASDPHGNDVAAERLLREARLIARIQHPHVATVHEFGRTAQSPAFLVLELVTGTTLRQFLAHARKLHWRTAVALTTQIASALQAAHAHGIVHCDLSPSNVLVARTDQGGLHCKLIDFGIADHASEPRSTPLHGTRRYAAPEAFAHGVADPRLDLHSLGVMLAEMLGDGTADTPRELTALARSLRAADPAERPASAAAVLTMLRRIVVERRSVRDRASARLHAPSRRAWCVAVAAVLLALAALVSTISLPRATRGATAPRVAPPPVRAELQPVAVRIPAAAARPLASLPAPRAKAPAVRVAAAVPDPLRRSLEAAIRRWSAQESESGRQILAPQISLDPSQSSARVTYRAQESGESPREAVDYWTLRDGRWQLLGD